MKLIKLSATILVTTCLLSACSGKNSTSGGKSDASNSTPGKSGDTTYTGKGSFAYTINGRHLAIKDFMNDGDGKNWMALFLNEVTNNTATGTVKVNITNELTKEVFNFTVANSATSIIRHFTPSLSNFADKKTIVGTYMSPKYKNYYADSVVVTITEINATHVAGTFGGKFLSEDNTPVPLAITDGSFDVPFTKNNNN